MKALTDYVREITNGKKPAGKLLRLTCERHRADVKAARKRGLKFDEEAAQRVIKFFSVLRHSKGEWAHREFVLEPWQIFIVASLFGWKRADGTRRFRRAYIEVPRKNGKSTLVAGIGLYLLVADGEPGAEIYTAGTKRDQARIVHGEAVRMVQASPLLRKEIGIFKDNLHVLETHSKYEPLGADADTMDGLNIHAAIIDEVHAHKTRNVIDVLDTATTARRQPLIIEITTAGWDKQSVCWEHHLYSEQVLNGIIEDDSWFAFISCADADDDWSDPATWRKANPNYGISVKADDLARKAARAKNVPAEQNTFKRLHLNIWTEQADRWLDMAVWDACSDAVDESKLAGRPCYVGVDLATSTDIAALVAVFPDDSEPTCYDVLPYFFMPEQSALERTRFSNIPFLAWAEAGLIDLTPGNVIDYDFIMDKLSDLAERYDLREVAYDRWGATQMMVKMQEGGMTVLPFGQGFVSMSPPTKELLTLLLARRIRHGGHPVLRWMASNVAVRQDPAGNLKPDKSASSEKIDGIVALIMGLARALLQGTESGTNSVYETEGIFVL